MFLHSSTSLINKGLTFLWLACTLQGCVLLPWETITPSDVKIADTEEFKKYVEQVFRRQNKVTNQLIEIFEEEPDNIDEETYDALEDAEEEMQDACVVLNKIAAQKSHEEKISLQLKYKALKTVGHCDRATKNVENLLAQLSRKVGLTTTSPHAQYPVTVTLDKIYELALYEKNNVKRHSRRCIDG